MTSVRRLYRRGNLDPAKVAELEQGVPGWVWDTKEDRFAQGLGLLWEYYQATGSASPTQFFVDPSGFMLGAWVGRLRTLYRAGVVPAEHVTQVEAVPGWEWNPRAQRWQSTLEALRECATGHGGSRVCPATPGSVGWRWWCGPSTNAAATTSGASPPKKSPRWRRCQGGGGPHQDTTPPRLAQRRHRRARPR